MACVKVTSATSDDVVTHKCIRWVRGEACGVRSDHSGMFRCIALAADGDGGRGMAFS